MEDEDDEDEEGSAAWKHNAVEKAEGSRVASERYFSFAQSGSSLLLSAPVPLFSFFSLMIDSSISLLSEMKEALALLSGQKLDSALAYASALFRHVSRSACSVAPWKDIVEVKLCGFSICWCIVPNTPRPPCLVRAASCPPRLMDSHPADCGTIFAAFSLRVGGQTQRGCLHLVR